jgi:Fic family protein
VVSEADPGAYRRIQNYVANSKTGAVIYTPPSAVEIPIMMSESEYYDRDRSTFYKKTQSVRENDMDMTGWLDYFITGLETQIIEVKERWEQVIRRDVLIQKHGLNERQGKALEFLLAHGKLTIKDFEELCPEVNRLSLQRDLKAFWEKGLIKETGTGPTDPTRHYVLS